MIRLLKAELARLRGALAFRLAMGGMLALASGFIFLQATAMDYTVPLTRVIFLPMSLYGVAMAAFVSVFVGTDFSDGFIRNKLLAARRRSDVAVAQLLACCVACAAVYIVTTAFSTGVGRFFFENDADGAAFFRFFLLGLGMSLSTGCLFAVVTLVCANKTRAIVWCMGLAFGMLFLCLHTNEVLVQTEYRDGALNPHYVGGFRRALCSVLHDLNPCGQAAQLSAWQVFHPVRAALCSLLLIAGCAGLGCALFQRMDIK